MNYVVWKPVQKLNKKLIELATLMQDEQKKMAIQFGDALLDDNWGHNIG